MKMHSNRKSRRSKQWYVIGASLLITLMVGCKTYQAPTRTPQHILPDTFMASTDSNSIADLPWQLFFKDTLLRRLIDATLANNLDLQQALQNIEVAAANYEQTAGLLRPAVSGIASVSAQKYGRKTLEGKNNRGTQLITEYFLGLQSSWEIDIWKKLRNQRKAAYLRLLASENGVQMVRTMLVSEVAKRYYDLLALDKKLEITRKNMALQQAAVDVVIIQKEGGRATELAVQQFKAQLLNTRSLEVQFQQQITAIENQINLLTRRPPQPISRSTSFPNLASVDAIALGVPSGLLLRRPDIREAELQLQASEADIAVARAAFFPTLTIAPFAGSNPINLARLAQPGTFAAGLAGGLAAPLFNRKAIQGNYNRATAVSQQAYLNYQNRINRAFYEVVNELNDLTNFQKVYTIKEQEAATLRNATEISQDLYKAGYASYLEIILAQRNVVDVELQVINTQNDIFQSYINLYRSLGGGWR